MSKRYRIGVIGLGARGETFARQLYTGTERAELFGLCDLDADRMERFCSYCGIDGARRFTDPKQFFSEPDMDAVIVTTPDFTHRDVAVQALGAGKHIYLEKPLAPTSALCREIVDAWRKSGLTAFVGFNMRADSIYQHVRHVVQSGELGQVLHIDALEQLSQAHSASFMRRFHRKTANTGGFLNHKCSHDLDIMQWIIGHEHRVAKVASFGGLDVFVPRKAPATHCHKCPRDVHARCPYKDRAGFVFPIGAEAPIHHREAGVYGGDLCVYTEDKDTIDNQTVIMEWEHGVRGNFNLQLFQHEGRRDMRIWGEKGVLDMDRQRRTVRIRVSDTGDTIERTIAQPAGGHGGTDPQMITRFVAAMDSSDASDSGLAQGLAATLVAEKARLSMETSSVMSIRPEEYA